MPDHDWDDHYLEGLTPWDSDIPEPLLVDYLRQTSAPPRRALDVGCGTGTHALWLATQDIEVLGIDVSATAIERAQAKAAQAGVPNVRFAVVDFLAAVPDDAHFDLVFDRGVFHVFDEADQRARFASQVARCLSPAGRWLSLIGSTEGPPRDEGPPRRSARDITAAIEPALEILELRTTVFDSEDVPPRAWRCLSRLRDVPAQASTTRPSSR